MARSSTQSSPGVALAKSSPAWSAALASSVLGVAIAAFGVYLLGWSTMSAVLAVALIVFGLMELVAGVFSLRGVRAAWAFALSMNGTAFVCTLFGAPKIRDAAEISGAAAAAPCVIFAVLALLLALSSDDF